MARVTRLLPPALLLLLLQGAPGVGAQADQDFQLQQPQDKVSVAAGETLTLTCTLSGDRFLGPVKWLKGWGSGNETIYGPGGSFPRVKRTVDKSSTDFSIRIRDVHPGDSGTYYCVKFRRSVGGEELFRHGKGTEVSVTAKPSPPVVSGPSRRASPRQSVPFTCTSGGFFPASISVKWAKNGTSISAQQPSVTAGQKKSSYSMSSRVRMELQEDDVRSWLSCEVQHPTLGAPLTGTYPLRDALRVSPGVLLDGDWRGPVELNRTVNFTCRAKDFYPGDVAISWLENGVEIKVENSSRALPTPRGLFEQSSVLEVKATEEKNGSAFTCRVVHDAQDPVSKSFALRVSAPSKEGLSDRPLADSGTNLLSSPILWLGILLEKGLLSGLLIFIFKRRRE
ncbi:tyrosine-protein phosphatase non-receptor type substrate 1-like [Colius striatus]|uniref:tyrosine-protein phosphatase non-receptor type substrate 1-like n=1 Tax=Colius striatus TaxID=57412 RepID=UPI002B1E23E8|nr:tyrosine-protein phosphatase non-receptor type substrate 1-like [Colius striatus]